MVLFRDNKPHLEELSGPLSSEHTSISSSVKWKQQGAERDRGSGNYPPAQHTIRSLLWT